MAERREQEKPLASAIPANSKLSPFPPEFISHRRHWCLKCCGCSAAFLLILAVTTLIHMLTIFHVRHPTTASFKFHEAATEVYYDGALVGEGRASPGEAGHRGWMFWLDAPVPLRIPLEFLLLVGLTLRQGAPVPRSNRWHHPPRFRRGYCVWEYETRD
ncbi:hypothetical protein SASPL_103948 [Salvia splendens]|uniref:Uncharacterized protein n=1 Tax=Salvia splendens TaxID=180675 RepID=A0A8X9A816_SALSN|nr:hypothetical protein SASPL_103948 [Salvia splendens]